MKSLETQRDSRASTENTQGHNESERTSRADLLRFADSAFPVTANDGCCSTRIGGDEVSGSNSSSEVSRLGQVTAEIAASGQCCVPTGCGCGPNGNSSLVEEQGQTPLGVDPLNGGPRDSVSGHGVADGDTVLVDLESGSPESGVNGHAEESVHRNSPEEDVRSEGGQACCQRKAENSYGDPSENPARAGYERRHENNAGTKADR